MAGSVRQMRRKKLKGPKHVVYTLIDPMSAVGVVMHRLLEEIREAHHEEIFEARIALAWCTSWHPDRDGLLVLGKCKKASDLDRELAAFDFVILLNKLVWQDFSFTEEQKRALVDHELCHADVARDPVSGDKVRDERGRQVFRIRKHDIEEFRDIVARHGCYKRDLEAFGKAILQRVVTEPYKPCEACVDSPGWVHADGKVARCACWKTWQERRAEALSA